MDNALEHYVFKQEIEDTCTAQGVWVRYLSLYSPDYNPIEVSFNDLKAFIRWYYRRYRA